VVKSARNVLTGNSQAKFARHNGANPVFGMECVLERSARTRLETVASMTFLSVFKVAEAVFSESLGANSRRMPQILRLFRSHKYWLALRCVFLKVGLRVQYLNREKNAAAGGGATAGALLRQPVVEATMARAPSMKRSSMANDLDVMANELLGPELQALAGGAGASSPPPAMRTGGHNDATGTQARRTVKVGASEWGVHGSDPRWDAHNLLGYAIVCPLVPDYDVVNGPLFAKENELWERQATRWSEIQLLQNPFKSVATAAAVQEQQPDQQTTTTTTTTVPQAAQHALAGVAVAGSAGNSSTGGWQPSFDEWQGLRRDLKELLELGRKQDDAQGSAIYTAM
jgi:hypothetical protein